VANDTNGAVDVFVHDGKNKTTDLVSVTTSGMQGDNDSTRPSISADGRFVAFDSSATNLVPGDTNSSLDVFLRDRTAGTTIRISVASDGSQGDASSFSPAISANGRFVTYVSDASNLVAGDTNNTRDIFVYDRKLKTTERESVDSHGMQGNSSSTTSAISATGRFVAFGSFSSNLVPGDVNGTLDVFVRDRKKGKTRLVSVATDGTQGDNFSFDPAINADGHLVAFASDATTLVPGDTNGVRDIFIHDSLAGTTERVSVDSQGNQANGQSDGPGVRGGTAFGPDISADGRLVTFDSVASNLVVGDTNTCEPFFPNPGDCPDIFVHDRQGGATVRVSVSTGGDQGNDASTDPAISEDGLSVAFFSLASNLVKNDTNICPPLTKHPGQCPDIFVHKEAIPIR